MLFWQRKRKRINDLFSQKYVFSNGERCIGKASSIEKYCKRCRGVQKDARDGRASKMPVIVAAV